MMIVFVSDSGFSDWCLYTESYKSQSQIGIKYFSVNYFSHSNISQHFLFNMIKATITVNRLAEREVQKQKCSQLLCTQ